MPASSAQCQSRSLGQHLGSRLASLGIDRFFSVPGDYNLALLDELVREEGLQACWTCNELNAGYAAEGYARLKGIGCLVVTFTVGGLSAINAVAGAYAENLPVVCITGGPNSNDFATNRVIHHTTGKRGAFMQELECFKAITCEHVVIQNLDDAHEQIDAALSAAVQHSKPVYICVCCNLGPLHHPSFGNAPIPYSITPRMSNRCSLEAAVRAAAEFLGGKQKPVLVAGALMRTAHAEHQFMELVEASGYAYAFMPAAKSRVPEFDHEQCMGTYWGTCSSPFCGEVVESADAQLFAGPLFSDYATAGYTLNLPPYKRVEVAPYRVIISGGAGGQVFGCVRMDDFLSGLAKAVQRNSTSLEIYKRMELPCPEVPPSQTGAPLQTKVLYKHLQAALTPQTVLLAETGDAIFNCQKLRLPPGCAYEWSQQYGSIGWAVGATLGSAVAAQGTGRRVFACIGDGSFQVTAQDVSTMLRYKLNPLILLINNGHYTIEVEIHDGPYNVLHSWDYVGFVRALDNSRGDAFAVRVATEEELVAAFEEAAGPASHKLCLIEAVIHRDDCSRELLEWGSLVSKANSRPPNQG